uniref:Metalloendopeptidase n=1 Tax=Saccoglossus kowalevskii TaxID=10224 RepID=A0ABM0GSB6_SACKO|nr:PREDICTED: zinc metalloproteinase nas-7-like [Saccoglossus kowalevskii]
MVRLTFSTLLWTLSTFSVIYTTSLKSDVQRDGDVESPDLSNLPPIMRRYSVPDIGSQQYDPGVFSPRPAMQMIVSRNSELIDAEIPGFLEGDMYIPDVKTKRSVIADESRRWPNAVVPYVIDPVYDGESVRKIESAMEEFHHYTCLRFVRRTYEEHYLYILPLDGCWSGFGYGAYAGQKISLGNGCVAFTVILHELMHALGFIHEQNRNDRDNYVYILRQNISPNFVSQFEKTLDKVLTHGTPYDYDSIMHYHRTAFTKDGQPTVISVDDYHKELGTATTFTKWDFVEINAAYKCGMVNFVMFDDDVDDDDAAAALLMMMMI